MMYFNLSSAIVDRVDLTMEEKMACVVLARYANNVAFDGLITIDVIAKKMGTSLENTQVALKSLNLKGLIDDFEELKQSVEDDFVTASSNVLHKEDADKLKAPNFDSFESQKTKQTVTDEEIMDIFEEIVPKNRLRILFGLAGEDLDVLDKAYHEVKKTHKYDVIDALAEYLQALAATPVKNAKPQRVQDELQTHAQQSTQSGAHKSLDFDEAKALLDLLENDVDSETYLKTGQHLNRQINLGKIQSAYHTKLKK